VASGISEDIFRLLFEEAADGMFIADSQSRLIAVNGQMLELTGYSGDELLGRHLNTLIYPEDLAREPTPLEDLAKMYIPDDTLPQA
jgi:PAS domain S-box-containing protein